MTCVLVVMSVLGAEAGAQLTGSLGAHDPSIILKDGDRYYYYATGRGIAGRRSDDLLDWDSNSRVFNSSPGWVASTVPGNDGTFWAPDVAYFNGLYHLYYSVSTFGSQVSAIGMATTPTLNRFASNYGWTDHGPVITSQVGSAYNAIDPAIFQDDDGRVWMSFGSFWDGIYLTELNPTTGMRLNTSTAPRRLADKSQIEAPFIFKRDGYYYLFVNWGWCCRGVDSTYNIRFGRSATIDGVYRDMSGQDMRFGGGSLLMATQGDVIGPGHISIFTEHGQDRFSYHYYDGADNGAATFGMGEVFWTADGWPTLVPPTLLTGDANNDGRVDGADLLMVARYMGVTGTTSGTLLGDANDDGVVDAADLRAVEQHFGSVLLPGGGAPTPEPASAAVLLGAALLLRRRR